MTQSKNMNKRVLTYFYIVVGFGLMLTTAAWADYQAGVDAYGGGDYETAMKEFRPLAEQGHARAQYNLGIMYEIGKGVPQDDQEAVKWYRRAADQGLAVAQYGLGMVYHFGRGVPQDYQEAVKWFRRAAEQGDASSQLKLGIMYEIGKGVPQDDQEAVKWYRRAGEQGEAIAQYNLGFMYREGKGVPQDDHEAVKWYRLAAEQGYALAQYNLAGLYFLGEGVPQDNVLAYMWANLAASQGHEAAVENRDMLARAMTPAQLAEAQRLAREWKPSTNDLANQTAALQELYRVLAVGGVMLITESCRPFINSWLVRLLFRHPTKSQKTAEEYIELIRSIGFHIDDHHIRTSSPWWSHQDFGLLEKIGFSRPKPITEILLVARKPNRNLLLG
jgi:TPR repeat protein